MASRDKIDYPKTKETCIRLFDYRDMQTWPPIITRGENWDNLYTNQTAGLSVLESLDEAIDWTNNFIARIDSTD